MGIPPLRSTQSPPRKGMNIPARLLVLRRLEVNEFFAKSIRGRHSDEALEATRRFEVEATSFCRDLLVATARR